MGRGQGATTGQGSQLLFGSGRRSGTPRVRISQTERAALALAQDIAAYEATGGVVEDHLDQHGDFIQQTWKTQGKLHRLNGPAIIYRDGSGDWYFNDEPHREGGPAMELHDGTRYWVRHGKPHRVDGPAIEHADGNVEWHLNGERYASEAAWQAALTQH